MKTRRECLNLNGHMRSKKDLPLTGNSTHADLERYALLEYKKMNRSSIIHTTVLVKNKPRSASFSCAWSWSSS